MNERLRRLVLLSGFVLGIAAAGAATASVEQGDAAPAWAAHDFAGRAVDFPAVTRELRDTAYDGWIVVEQDVLPGMGQPKEYARRNREYLKKCGL